MEFVIKNVAFDTSNIAYEDINYLFLFGRIHCGRTATKNYTYEALANAVNLHTGGMRFAVATYDKEGDVDSYMPKFVFKAKVLVDKMPELIKLLQEIIFNSSLFLKNVLKIWQCNVAVILKCQYCVQVIN